MFLIFKILPDWFWWLLLTSGLIGILLSQLPQAKSYEIIIKSLSGTLVATTIFILGMLYSDNAWKAAAAELEAKVVALSKQAEATNETIKEKTLTKLQVVRVRGNDVIQYIDREVTKSDASCVIPNEFVQAHNRAAEVPK